MRMQWFISICTSGSGIKEHRTAANLDWFQVGVLLNDKFPDHAEDRFILKLKTDGEILAILVIIIYLF